MSLINICRDNHDPFYRYKMPPIQAKTEGHGNGIKTNVLNAADVARALVRPTKYMMKYFGFELGAQVTVNDEKERYLVNGVHDANKLQDVLDGFINKFVLCPSCKNPETVLHVSKDGQLTRDCKACGKVTTVDPRLKLVTYILKNPPEDKPTAKSATASANVVGGGKSIADIAARQQAASGDKPVADGAPAPTAERVVVKDDEWAVDMSEEAIKARAKELEAMTLQPETAKYDQFGEWLLKEIEADAEAEDEDPEIPLDVAIYKKAHELDILADRKTIEVLAQCLFDEDIVEEIAEHKGLISKLVSTPKDEKSLLGGIERMIGLQHPELIPAVPKILMQLYQEDLVSEDVIKDYGTHVSKKYVPKDQSKKIRRAAKPFLKWLEEAEETSEDEEESSDEE